MRLFFPLFILAACIAECSAQKFDTYLEGIDGLSRLKSAAASGDDRACAILSIVFRGKYGPLGEPTNFNEVKMYAEKSAEHNNPIGLLSLAKFNGLVSSVEQVNKAVPACLQAAKNGDAWAAYYLGEVALGAIDFKTGVSPLPILPSQRQAVELLNQAAKAGLVYANELLGFEYESSNNTNDAFFDRKQAAHYFAISGAKGLPFSLISLGQIEADEAKGRELSRTGLQIIETRASAGDSMALLSLAKLSKIIGSPTKDQSPKEQALIQMLSSGLREKRSRTLPINFSNQRAAEYAITAIKVARKNADTWAEDQALAVAKEIGNLIGVNIASQLAELTAPSNDIANIKSLAEKQRDKTFVFKGFYIGMPIADTVKLLNFYAGREQFKALQSPSRIVALASADNLIAEGDDNSNLVSLAISWDLLSNMFQLANTETEVNFLGDFAQAYNIPKDPFLRPVDESIDFVTINLGQRKVNHYRDSRGIEIIFIGAPTELRSADEAALAIVTGGTWSGLIVRKTKSAADRKKTFD